MSVGPPTPTVPWLAFPSLAFSQAMKPADRRVGDQRHRGEIVHHVVGQVHRRGIEHVGLGVADADRVAVGRGLRDPADPDAAAGAAHVLDHHRLAEAGLHALGQDAGERVGRPARRIRHHHRDRARRIDLGVGGAASANEAERREQDCAKPVHLGSSRAVVLRKD
jgi:hypothetical protein